MVRPDYGASFSMGKKLFVGGLSWGTDDEMLRASFEKFGEIEEAKVIVDRETGRSRGFGFVTFNDDKAALNAVSEMDGQPIDGRTVKVNEANEKPERGQGDRNFGSNRGGPRSFGSHRNR